MMMAEEIIDKIKSFQDDFDPKKMGKEMALSLARDLRVLSDHIFEAYNEKFDEQLLIIDQHKEEFSKVNDPQLGPKRKFDNATNQCSSAGDADELKKIIDKREDAINHKEDSLEVSSQQKKRDTVVIVNEERGTNMLHHDGIPRDPSQISRERIASLLNQTAFRGESMQQRMIEAQEAVDVAGKPVPQSTCGVSYKDTSKVEKDFSANFRSKMMKAFPSIKNQRQLFYFMAFSSLDRISCPVCSKCENSPQPVINSIKNAHSLQNSENPKRTMENLFPTPSQSFDGTDSGHSLIDEQLDVNNVLEMVHGIDYYKLGIALGISKDTLVAIKKDNMNDFERIAEVIDSWLKRRDKATPRSWKSLVDAVSGTIINDPQCAGEISAKYL